MKYQLYLLTKLFKLLFHNPQLLLNKFSQELRNLFYKRLTTHQFIQLVNNMSNLPLTVVVNSVGKGGANTYLNNYIKNLTGTVIVFQSRNIFRRSIVKIYNQNCKYSQVFSLTNGFNSLNNFLIDRVIVNHLLFSRNLNATIDALIKLTSRANVKLTVMMHDYYYICPSVNLLNYNNQFCNLPDTDTCNNCLKRFNHNSYSNNYVRLNGRKSITHWRNNFTLLLNMATNIIVPSVYAKNLVSRTYPQFMFKIMVVSPNLDYLTRLNNLDITNKNNKLNKLFTVAILGEINQHKGAHIVYELIEFATRRNFGWRFVVIGNIIPRRYYHNLQVTGSYLPNQLPGLVSRYSVDAFIIPSIWPETYCYTADEAMQFKLPVAAFNIGAHGQRIANYEFGRVVSDISVILLLNTINELTNCPQ
jgi:glycosyltransferase involved in cell wall biosynthesis